MKARLAVIGVVLVMASVVVMWLGSGLVASGHAPVGAPAAESRRVDASSSAVGRPVQRRGDGATDATVAREPLAAVVVEDAAAPDKNLRIVDEHGAPVPGAEYFEGPWPYHSFGGLSVQAAMQERWRPDVWLTTKCTRQFADAGGWVQCRPSDTPWLGVARHGDRQGRGVRWGEPNELPLLPPKPCHVVVVGASGAPIEGASVIVRYGEDGDQDVIVGVTDAAGECLAADLDRLARDRWLRSPLSTCRFGVRGLGLRASEVPFDVEEPPDQVRLRLPPCGMVAIEVRGTDGARTASAEPVVLGTDHEDLLDAYEFVEEYAQASGPVDVGLVACDAQLVASTCRLYDGVPNGTRRFRGPSVDGERTVLTLDPLSLRPGGRMLTGRVVFEDSRPSANIRLDAQNESFTGSTVVTDDAGRFFLAVAKEELELLSEGSLIFVQEEPGVDRRPPRVARCVLPDMRNTSVADVGDVVLRDPTLLVRGRVQRAGASGEAVVIDSISVDLEAASATWDELGAFEVRGVTDVDQVRLDIEVEGCRDRVCIADVGDPECIVNVEPVGGVVVHVLVDPACLGQHAPLGDLILELVDAGGGRLRAGFEKEGDEATCKWNVLPGTYDLHVSTMLDPAPIAIERGVAVRAGEDVESTIDLRGRLRAMEVLWSASDGARVDRMHSVVVAQAVRAGGGSRWRDVFSVRAGGCTLFGVGGPVDIEVFHDGCSGHYRGPLADCAITLEPIVEVPFEIPDLPAAPADAEWKVRLMSIDGEADVGWRSETYIEPSDAGFILREVGAGGRGTIPIATDTTYEVELLFCPDESVRPFVALPAIPPELVVGDELPKKLVFRFAPDAMQSAAR